MPVRRCLRMDNAHQHPASKIPVPKRNHAHVASSQTGNVIAHKEEFPQAELERLEFLRFKLEQSLDAFIKARKELEGILSAEGSSQQGRLLTGSSDDLKTELKRLRELTSKLSSL